jgi:DNA-binding MarR family transcriptional regulator
MRGQQTTKESKAGAPGSRPATTRERPVTSTKSGQIDDQNRSGQLDKTEYQRLAELRHALRRFARHTELESRRRGVSPQQYLLMLAIKGFPGRDQANITELAERLQVRHNAVIGLVNRAETHGLVVRIQDADRGDRRVVLVRLTDLGERVLQAMAEALRSERARVRAAVEAVNEL